MIDPQFITMLLYAPLIALFIFVLFKIFEHFKW